MTKIPRRSVMIYGKIQAEFVGTKHNVHIHRNVIPIFGDFFLYKPINIDNQILWRL